MPKRLELDSFRRKTVLRDLFYLGGEGGGFLALAPSRFFGCAIFVFSEDSPVFEDLKKKFLQTPSLTMAQYSVLQFVCVETLLNHLYVCILSTLL